MTIISGKLLLDRSPPPTCHFFLAKSEQGVRNDVNEEIGKLTKLGEVLPVIILQGIGAGEVDGKDIFPHSISCDAIRVNS